MKYSSVGIYLYRIATAHSLFPGYRWLHEHSKILHRDISLNNLMLRKEGGNVYAVLNNLDLAVNVDAQGQSSKHRTGTKPFMAIDLLGGDPTVHLYRHDLESLFYVLVWIITRYHNGKEITNPPLQDWAGSDHRDLLKTKALFLLEGSPEPTDNFKSFRGHVSDMRTMFQGGHSARRKAIEDSKYKAESQGGPGTSHFAYDTLGGSVTFDTFQRILDACLDSATLGSD